MRCRQAGGMGFGLADGDGRYLINLIEDISNAYLDPRIRLD